MGDTSRSASGRRSVHRLLLAGVSLIALGLGGDLAASGAGSVPVVSSTKPCAGTGTPPAVWSHVTLIAFENKPFPMVIDEPLVDPANSKAPYINKIAKACSYSNNNWSVSATSLADYIALTSGHAGCADTLDPVDGCTEQDVENQPPSLWPQPQASIFEQMNETSPAPTFANSAVQWAQSMPAPNCYPTSDGNFMVQHAPYQYYTRAQETCPTYARPFPATRAKTLSAKFNLVVANRTNIMHRPWKSGTPTAPVTVATQVLDGDKWLAGFLPKLLDSATYKAGKSVILITWDEGNDEDFRVPLIVISPYTEIGEVSSAVTYDHYSTLKGIQTMLGQTTLLGHAADPGQTNIRDDLIFRLKPTP